MSAQQETSTVKVMLKSAIMLTIYAIIGAGLVAFTYQKTKDQINDNENNVLISKINELIPSNSYNNVIHNDKKVVTDPALGASMPVTIYLARMNQLPVAVAITTDAPDGYGGAIRLLIGVRTDLSLTGVRVIAHTETPGLGDKIDLQKSPWVLAFNDASLSNPPEAQWAVKKDGGVFEQFSGATVTPRAVVNAVRRTLKYVSDNKDSVFYN
jgi:electron transport complex protein RnfG